MKSFIESQCDEIAADFMLLKGMSADIEAAARMWIDALQSGGKVMFCGNGGSAADTNFDTRRI